MERIKELYIKKSKLEADIQNDIKMLAIATSEILNPENSFLIDNILMHRQFGNLKSVADIDNPIFSAHKNKYKELFECMLLAESFQERVKPKVDELNELEATMKTMEVIYKNSSY